MFFSVFIFFNSPRHTNQKNPLSFTTKDLVSKDAKAAATKLFDRFYHADEFQETVDAFDRILDVLGIRSGSINQFYPIVRVRKEQKKNANKAGIKNQFFFKVSLSDLLSLFGHLQPLLSSSAEVLLLLFVLKQSFPWPHFHLLFFEGGGMEEKEEMENAMLDILTYD